MGFLTFRFNNQSFVHQSFYQPAVNLAGAKNLDPVFLLKPADKVAPAAPLLFVLFARRPSERFFPVIRQNGF